MKIKLLITGGTIDKNYDKRIGELVFADTHLVEMLARGRSKVDISSEVLFLKDSLDITDFDRQCILKQCLNDTHNRILISHGTDTMVKTAQLLGENIKDKTIVLFGAMTPYAVNNSDALFNLGFAISCVQAKNAGVYIAMNGKIFDFDNVIKNQDLSIFQNLND